MKRVINGKTYSKVLGIKQGSLLTAGKDGDIEEYKADVADAGKVLTVGEDGGVAPAEAGGGGGSTKYVHNVILQFLNGGVDADGYCSFLLINESQSMTYENIMAYLFTLDDDTKCIAASGRRGSELTYTVLGIRAVKSSGVNVPRLVVGLSNGQSNYVTVTGGARLFLDYVYPITL